MPESDNIKTAKKIPYGISDYEKIVQGNYYYVDKTAYLQTIEDAGDYLFFIRPRRFGKSLFLSVMETYYDIAKADRFDLFYKGTNISRQPTQGKNRYLVLKFNFSAVDPHPARIEASFFNNIEMKVTSFLYRYWDLFKSPYREKARDRIENTTSAADLLLNITSLCNESNQKLYITIDEYDNFANTILSTSGSKAYQDLTHGEGFFRAFFNFLKEGTTGSGSPISRLFITGVSPVTMDDVTSGFNIGMNISLDPAFNEILGFTVEEVKEMFGHYRGHDLVYQSDQYLLEIMNRWYNHYIFSPESKTTLFNSDMVLYFIYHVLRNKKLPGNLIDRNVRIDYGKLRYLITVDKAPGEGLALNGNFSRLSQVVEDEKISAELVDGFPLEQLKDTNNFISLLYYFGLLTIDAPEKDKIRLKIPNETVKRLYFDYISEGLRETGIFGIDLYRYSELLTGMAYDGNWQPFFQYICGRMRESMSLRDLITGEKAVQAFLSVYLGLNQLYIIHREKEMNKGFADIALEPFLARYEGIKYSYLMETKYIKAGAKPGDADVQRLKTKAEKQLAQYAVDETYRKSIVETTLIKLVLIFSGHQLVYIGESR